MTTTNNPTTSRRTDDEVVLRLPTLGRVMRAFLPEAAVQHMNAARREQLLAMRSMLDAAIERVDARAREAGAPPHRTEIRVE